MASKTRDDPAQIPLTAKSSSTKAGSFRTLFKKGRDTASSLSPKDGTSAAGSEASSDQRKGSGSRIKRLLKGASLSNGATDDNEAEGAAGTAAGKRRQQIYQAQKRHRNRRAEYIKSLENEVAKLRNMDSHVRREKSSLETQNRFIKSLLASHAIDTQLDSMNLTSTASTADGDVAMNDVAAIDIRMDADLGNERTFLDFVGSEDMAWSSATTSATPEAKPTEPVKGDSWAALDFILALEWPCRGHMNHARINPVKPHIECKLDDFTGHALLATAAVYDSALPPPTHVHKHTSGDEAQNATGSGSEGKWVLPHSEIDKLVKLSEDLPIDDEKMTPAQAYSAIRKNLKSDQDLKPILELLKIPLGAIVECEGYGAALPVDQFWQHLETALTSLDS